MLRISAGAAMSCRAHARVPALASAPPVGPLPPGPVTSISTPKGSLVSVALPSRAGKSWRLARAVSPKVLVEVSEATSAHPS